MGHCSHSHFHPPRSHVVTMSSQLPMEGVFVASAIAIIVCKYTHMYTSPGILA